LDAEHHGDDVLVVDRVRAGRTRAVHPEDGRALVRRVEVRPLHVDADVEIRMRIPLRARTHLPVAEARVARVARQRSDGDGADREYLRDAAGRTGEVRVDDRGRGAVVVDLGVAAVERGAPLRRPQVLDEAVDAPDRGELDVRVGVVHAVGGPPEPGIVAGVIHLPGADRARAVPGGALRVAGLQAELVTLEAEDVVQCEPAGHR